MAAGPTAPFSVGQGAAAAPATPAGNGADAKVDGENITDPHPGVPLEHAKRLAEISDGKTTKDALAAIAQDADLGQNNSLMSWLSAPGSRAFPTLEALGFLKMDGEVIRKA